MIVGLTGGIGSGKTAVSNWFFSQNIDVVDADIIAHQLTEQDSPLLDTLRETFGDWVIDEAGNYNRQAMRAFIFDKPDKLAKLNAIIHPAVQQSILHSLKQSRSSYKMLVVPLLFEKHQHSPLFGLCQQFLVVDSPVALQIARATRRDSTGDIQKILSNQLSRQERLALAQELHADVVVNDQDLPTLYAQLLPLHQKYLALAHAQK